ncbi:uncharacterized protein LOC132933880 [Metopolophium dirhodum]|uniref:uncharacterized protein LOC132933880 n=1 Tax=Metopolophium dirhodum TaxID=44670 RepID=UPI00298FC532|nr:uncharacterized protein LOC132933880 [Metopolophium dirhodum]
MNNDSESKDNTLTRNSNPTDDEDVTFFFFYDIVKQLILKRNDIGDSCVLSSWLKVLEQNKNKFVRNEYIKLMTLALQYPEPICPFKDPPPETIDPLENGVIEMARKFLKKEGTATCIGNNEEETFPTISTAMSYDKRQYASYQVIPNVGVQCYYAFSDEPMYNWNLSSQISVPKGGPHATDIEWERALAGIQLKLHKPSTDNIKLPNARKNATAKDDENEVKSSVSGSRASRKKSDRLKESGETSDLCDVMNIEQQNRNVNEAFEWNDASLLTGDIRLGAEMCSDRKVDAQVKTQIELDKEAFNAYDKLYPGDFLINVEQSLIDDIIPIKINVVTESGDKKTIKEDEQQKQPSAQDGSGCGGAKKKQRECPRPKLCTIRQSAGHGNVKPPPEESRPAVEKSLPSEHQRPRISDLARKLAALNAPDGRTGHYKSRNTFVDPPARRPTPADDYRAPSSGRRSPGGYDECGGGRAGLRPARSTESRAERNSNSGMPFRWSERPSMTSDFTGERSEKASSMLRSRRTDPKCVSLAQLYGRSAKSRDDESGEPSSDV